MINQTLVAYLGSRHIYDFLGKKLHQTEQCMVLYNYFNQYGCCWFDLFLEVNNSWKCFFYRIDWLQQGSRELFGTVIEDQIYILIDTSASMAPHIQFLKDKLFVLMQVINLWWQTSLYNNYYINFTGDNSHIQSSQNILKKQFWNYTCFLI